MKTAHRHIRVAWSAKVRFICGFRSGRLQSGGRLASLRAGPLPGGTIATTNYCAAGPARVFPCLTPRPGGGTAAANLH